jgi:hypothetical protein
MARPYKRRLVAESAGHTLFISCQYGEREKDGDNSFLPQSYSPGSSFQYQLFAEQDTFLLWHRILICHNITLIEND